MSDIYYEVMNNFILSYPMIFNPHSMYVLFLILLWSFLVSEKDPFRIAPDSLAGFFIIFFFIGLVWIKKTYPFTLVMNQYIIVWFILINIYEYWWDKRWSKLCAISSIPGTPEERDLRSNHYKIKKPGRIVITTLLILILYTIA